MRFLVLSKAGMRGACNLRRVMGWGHWVYVCGHGGLRSCRAGWGVHEFSTSTSITYQLCFV